MIAKEESTDIVSFMTPGAGSLVLVCGHKRHIVQLQYNYNVLFLLKKPLLYFWGWLRQTQKDSCFICPLNPIVLRLYCSFPLPLLIFIYYMMGLLISNMSPSNKKSVYSDIQVTVKACGPLVYYYYYDFSFSGHNLRLILKQTRRVSEHQKQNSITI